MPKITIPDSVTSIGETAFCGDSALTEASLGSKVTEIAYGAFSNCKNLPSITFPNSVKSIGDSAFQSCYSMKKIHFKGDVPSGNTTWTNDKMQNYGGNLNWGIWNPSTGAIIKQTDTIKDNSNKSKKIGRQAFYNCKKLKSYKKLMRSKGAGNKVKFKC